jgi:hypothetical protein
VSGSSAWSAMKCWLNCLTSEVVALVENEVCSKVSVAMIASANHGSCSQCGYLRFWRCSPVPHNAERDVDEHCGTASPSTARPGQHSTHFAGYASSRPSLSQRAKQSKAHQLNLRLSLPMLVRRVLMHDY